MNEDWVGEEVLDSDSPDLPDALRKQGNLYKNKARYVIDLGGGNMFYMQRMENCWMLF